MTHRVLAGHGIAKIGHRPGELRQETRISALAISGDGLLVATGDDRGTVRLFDASSASVQERKCPSQIRKGPITDIVMSTNGRTLVVAYSDVLWIVDTATFDRAPGIVRRTGRCQPALSFNGRILATMSPRGLTLADLYTRHQTTTPHHPDATPYGVAFFPHSDLVAVAYATAGLGRQLRLVDTTGAVVAEVDAPRRDATFRSGCDIAVQPDGTVVLAHGALTLVAWDGRSAVHERRFAMPDIGPYWAAPRLLAPTGAAAVPLADNAVAIVDLETGKVRGDLPDRRRQLAVTVDGRTLFSSAGHVVERHDGTTLEPGPAGTGLAASVNAVAFEPDGAAVWTADHTSVRRWRLPDGDLDIVVPTRAPACRLTTDATAALVSGRDSGQVLALPSGVPIGQPTGRLHQTPGLSPDGVLVASAGPDGSGVRIWDTGSGRILSTPGLDSHRASSAMAFSRSGRLVAAGCDDRQIVVWNAQTGATLGSFTAPRRPPLALDISPDETMLAIGSDDRTLHVVTLPDGAEQLALRGHTRRAVRAVAFAPDSRIMASSDGRDTRLWHTATGASAGVARLGANALAFSTDGRYLAAGGDAIAWIIDVDRLSAQGSPAAHSVNG